MCVTSVTTALGQDVTYVNTSLRENACKAQDKETSCTTQQLVSCPSTPDATEAPATSFSQSHSTHSNTNNNNPDPAYLSKADNQHNAVVTESQSDTNTVCTTVLSYSSNNFTHQPKADPQDGVKSDSSLGSESLLSQVFSKLDVFSFFERECDELKITQLLPYIEPITRNDSVDIDPSMSVTSSCISDFSRSVLCEDGAGGKDKGDSSQTGGTSNTQSTAGGGGGASAGNTSSNTSGSEDGMSQMDSGGDDGGEGGDSGGEAGADDSTPSESSLQCLLCMEEYPTQYSLAVHVAQSHPVKVNVTKLSQVRIYHLLKMSTLFYSWAF